MNSEGMNSQMKTEDFQIVNPKGVNNEKNPQGFFEWNSRNSESS